MRIAVIMTCYNRANTTVECLRRLFSCKRPTNMSIDVWINDDGCTDDTCARVNAMRDNAQGVKIHVVNGSGHDYWCGGMRRAWEASSSYEESDKSIVYDGWLWLNDDTWLDEDALKLILEAPEQLTAAAICSRDRTKSTYGGFDDKGHPVEPNGTLREITTFNGNCVWVPRKVFEQIGGMSNHWSHALGDVDYGRRAGECGLRVYLTRAFVGTCDRNSKPVVWTQPGIPLIQRLKNLYSPLSYGMPSEIFRYCWCHDGPIVAFKNLITQHIRVFFPRLWRAW